MRVAAVRVDRSVSVGARSWALAKGSYLVVRLLGGRGAQDGVVRVVALQKGCSHFRDDRDHMGSIPVHVVEYTAAAPAVSHAAPLQHAWALTPGANLVVKLAAGAHWDGVVSWLAALCKQLLFVIARC